MAKIRSSSTKNNIKANDKEDDQGTVKNDRTTEQDAEEDEEHSRILEEEKQ